MPPIVPVYMRRSVRVRVEFIYIPIFHSPAFHSVLFRMGGEIQYGCRFRLLRSEHGQTHTHTHTMPPHRAAPSLPLPLYVICVCMCAVWVNTFVCRDRYRQTSSFYVCLLISTRFIFSNNMSCFHNHYYHHRYDCSCLVSSRGRVESRKPSIHYFLHSKQNETEKK